MARRIQLRRDTAAAWSAANPILAQGEVGVDITNNKLKIGDGTTAWNTLGYWDDKEPSGFDGTYASLTGTPNLADVATSGDYEDLINTPAIPDLANVSQDIIPDTDVTYDLGSPTNRFRDLYLSGNTINLGGVELSTTADGSLKVLGGITTGNSFNGFAPNTNSVLGTVSADRKTLTFVPPLQTGWTLEPTIKLGTWHQEQPTTDEPTFSWNYANGEVNSVTVLTGGSGYDFNDIMFTDGEIDTGIFYINPNPNEVYTITGVDESQRRFELLDPFVVDATSEFTVDMVNKTVTGTATATGVIRGLTYQMTFGLKYRTFEGVPLDGIMVDSAATTVTVDSGVTLLASQVVNFLYLRWQEGSWILNEESVPNLVGGAFNPETDVWFSFDKQQFNETFAPLLSDGPSSGTVSGPLSAVGNSSVSGDLTVTGDVTVDGDLYVSPNSLYLGNLKLSTTDDTTLLINDAPLSGGNASTGDVTFSGVKVIGAGTASGDGAGYSTLELVPDNTLYNNNQYLVVDPTAPSHIHVRAGGTQDASNAELFLGGEQKYVRVSDFNGVRLQDQRVNNNYYYFASPDIQGGNWYYDDNAGLSFVIVASDNNALLGTRADEFLNNPQNILNFSDGTTTYPLTSAGSLNNLGGGTYRIGVNEAPPPEAGGAVNLVSVEFVINSIAINYLEVQNNDFRVQVVDDVRITGGDIVRLSNNSPTEPITIITDYNNTEKTWAFNPDGSLTFPNASGNINVTNSYINLSSPNGVELQYDSGKGLMGIEVGEAYIKPSDSTGTLTAEWLFLAPTAGEGSSPAKIVFPDLTEQTTAWDPNNTDWAAIIGPAIQFNGLPVGTRFTQPVPLTSKGAEGDAAGTVAFDGSYIYYCTATWTDGVADIWKRVAWSADTW